MPEPRRFRFKPRFKGLAATAVGLGGVLGGVSLVALGAAFLPLVTGAAGVVLGATYLLSPTWKLEVVVDLLMNLKGVVFNLHNRDEEPLTLK